MKLSTILVSAVAITSSIVPCTGADTNTIRGDGRPDNLPPFEFDCDIENRIEVLKKSQAIVEITTSYLSRIPTAVAYQGDDDGQPSMWFLQELQKLPALSAFSDLGKLIAAHADDNGLVTKIGVTAAIAEYLKDECADAIVVGYGPIVTLYGSGYGKYGGYTGGRRIIV